MQDGRLASSRYLSHRFMTPNSCLLSQERRIEKSSENISLLK